MVSVLAENGKDNVILLAQRFLESNLGANLKRFLDGMKKTKLISLG